jgi:hypothetical protein
MESGFNDKGVGVFIANAKGHNFKLKKRSSEAS